MHSIVNCVIDKLIVLLVGYKRTLIINQTKIMLNHVTCEKIIYVFDSNLH